MKSKSNVQPPGPFKNFMRTFLPFDAPTNTQQSVQNMFRFSGAPLHDGQINEKPAEAFVRFPLYQQAF